MGRDERIALALILASLVVAVAVRAISALSCGPAGPQEVRYITIGQGLLAGEGFQGIDKRFPDIIQPPLHPFLLALSILVLRDPLPAGRVLSIGLDALLVLPIALFSWRLHGASAAWRAAWLIAVYPLLIHFSGIALTEPVFGLLVACALAAIQAATSSSRGMGKCSLLAGALLGLAFLARPEGLAYAGAGAAFIFVSAWLAMRSGVASAVRWAGLLMAGFIVFAAPYSVWLHARTGHWLISPKAVMTQVHNMIMTEGIRENWPEREGTAVFYERVKFGLNAAGDDLRSSEAFRDLGLLPSGDAPTRGADLLGEVIQPTYLVRVVSRNFRTLYLDTLKYGLVLPTILLALLALGIVARPWAPGAERRSQVLLAWFLVAGCSWALSYVQPRFLYASMALSVVWMARGWVAVEEWLSATFLGSAGRRNAILRPAAACALAVLFGAAAMAQALSPAHLTEHHWREHRGVGEKLREISPDSRPVMALTPVVPFYAGLPFELLPYDSLERVLEYARQRKVRYLVVHEETLRLQRPQLAILLDPPSAPPVLRHVLTAGSGKSDGPLVIVYELVEGAGPSSDGDS